MKILKNALYCNVKQIDKKILDLQLNFNGFLTGPWFNPPPSLVQISVVRVCIILLKNKQTWV